jgi:D-alanine-D-alanine ligase-like ATP-grasp enzyme
MRDVARLDFRIAPDGRIYLLEANAIPLAGADSSALFVATAQLGLGYQARPSPRS